MLTSAWPHANISVDRSMLAGQRSTGQRLDGGPQVIDWVPRVSAYLTLEKNEGCSFDIETSDLTYMCPSQNCVAYLTLP